MYRSEIDTDNLKDGQLVICKCPEWNDEGFQIATWNKRIQEFEYCGQPNDMFHDTVTHFACLDEDGEFI